MSRRLTVGQHFALLRKLSEEKNLPFKTEMKLIVHITMFHIHEEKIEKILRKQQTHARVLNAHFKSPEMQKHLAEI